MPGTVGPPPGTPLPTHKPLTASSLELRGHSRVASPQSPACTCGGERTGGSGGRAGLCPVCRVCVCPVCWVARALESQLWDSQTLCPRTAQGCHVSATTSLWVCPGNLAALCAPPARSPTLVAPKCLNVHRALSVPGAPPGPLSQVARRLHVPVFQETGVWVCSAPPGVSVSVWGGRGVRARVSVCADPVPVSGGWL